MLPLTLAAILSCSTPEVAPPEVPEPAPTEEAGGPVAIVGATVWDGTGAPALSGATVLVDDQGRVEAVGTEVVVPQGARVLDAAGKFVVPGLVDAHVHFFQSGGLYTRPDIVDLRAVRSYEEETEGIRARIDDTFARTLASGVTAVVDMGGPMWNFEVRQAAADRRGPRVAVAGPLISTVERPQLVFQGDPPIIRAEDPDHARELVRAQLERDPDLVKIWYILPESGDPSENLPVVEAVIDESHQAGVRVAVHATQLETARAAVIAGADVLVHSVDDAPVDEAFAQLLVDRGVPLVTTLVVLEGYAEVLGQRPDLTDLEWALGDPVVQASWGELAVVDDPTPPERLAARLERFSAAGSLTAANTRALHEAGVVIAAGTDAGNIGTLHGPSMHRELELLVEAGLSPEAALLAGTRDAARVFAAEPDLGTLVPGNRADLLVLDVDPLADLAALQWPHRVVLGGEILDPRALVDPHPAWVVQRQVDAYNARDLEAFVATYAEDVVVERWDGEEVLRGHEGLRVTYGPLFEASPALHCRILERLVSGSFVVDHELVTGLRGGPAARAVAIYEVSGHAISRVTFLPRSR